MSINISIHPSSLNIRKGKVLLTDIENVKRNEVNRRRRLRLEQVRQQSKDIANKVRQRVRGECDKQIISFDQKQSRELKKLQSQKLLLLQQKYQDCLDEVGTGHVQAALQPDSDAVLEAERESHHEQAEARGRKATAKLKQEQADREEKRSAVKKQQQFSRTIEELRSAMVASLGKKSPKRTPKIRQQKKKPLGEISNNIPEDSANRLKCTCGCSICICKPSPSFTGEQEIRIPTSEKCDIFPPAPPKSWTVSFNKSGQSSSTLHTYRDDNSEEHETKIAGVRPVTDGKFSDESNENISESSAECNCTNVPRLQINGTVSSLSSSSSSSSLTKTNPSSEVIQSNVRFYDHGNRFETEYQLQAKVERMLPLRYEPNACESAELEAQTNPTSRNVYEEKKFAHIQARGDHALARERLHRDYKNLLNNLQTLSREERLIRSTRTHSLPPQIFLEEYRRKELNVKRQKNMDSAFESVYHSVHQDSVSRPPSVAETVTLQDKAHHLKVLEQDEPAVLNVADWQASSFKQVTVSADSTDKAATCNEPDVHMVTATQDAEHTPETMHIERKDTTLEDLVKRVNIQRSLLFKEINRHVNSSREPILQESLIPQKQPIPVDSPKQPIKISSASVLLSSSSSSSSFETRDEMHEKISADKKSGGIVDHISETKSNEQNLGTSTVHQKPVKYLKEKKSGKQSREGIDKVAKQNNKEGKRRQKEKIEKSKYKKDETVQPLIHEPMEERETGVLEKDDSVTIVSEYSFDMSVTKSAEHTIESSMGSSTSTSYEGVKIIVSVSESTEKIPHPGRKELANVTSPQKQKRREKCEKKICKCKQAKIAKLQREHGRAQLDDKSFEEKATMTLESEFGKPDDGKSETSRTDIIQERVLKSEKESKEELSTLRTDQLDELKKWHQKFNKNLSSDKELSEASTTYLSPPVQVTPSCIPDLDTLLTKAKSCQEKRDDGTIVNPLLTQYILRLLGMSRESIEDLSVSTSDISTPDLESDLSNGLIHRNERQNVEPRCKKKVDAMEVLINTVREKTKSISDKVAAPHVESDFCSAKNELASPTVSETKRTDSLPHLYNEAPSLYSSCRAGERLCEIDMTTPPFPSAIADMSLDEYKVVKFPEIFSDYSEKCSKRISDLAKTIEKIRGETRKLMEFPESGSSISSNSSGFDSTKYLSPPDSSAVMTNKIRENVVPLESSNQASCVCPSASTQEVSENIEIYLQVENDGSKSQQNVFRRSRPHSRPPPCHCQDKLQSGQQVKELSTIIESESIQPSQDSGSEQPEFTKISSIGSDKSSDGSELWQDDNVPDVMTEMLKRGLITSPINWTEIMQEEQAEKITSMGSLSESHKGSDISSSSEESFKDAVFRTYVGEGIKIPQKFRDRKSSIDKKSKDFKGHESNVEILETYSPLIKKIDVSEHVESEIPASNREPHIKDFPYQVMKSFSKLGVNPSKDKIVRSFKKIGLKANNNESSGIPTNYEMSIDTSSEKFRQLVLQSFVGLSADSTIRDLEKAFQKIGVLHPGESLVRLNEESVMPQASSPISPSTVPNSNDSCGPSSSASSTMLPPIPSSNSQISDDSSTS